MLLRTDYFYLDEEICEVKNKNKYNDIESVVDKIRKYKLEIINKITNILGEKLIIYNYDSDKKIKVYMHTNNEPIKVVKKNPTSGYHLNVTLPHKKIRKKILNIIEVKNDHINLIKAMILINPILLAVYSNPDGNSFNELNKNLDENKKLRKNENVVKLSKYVGDFNTIDVDDFYDGDHYTTRGRSNDFRNDYAIKMGLLNFDNASHYLNFYGVDFRLNEEYFDPMVGYWFGFEYRLLNYQPDENIKIFIRTVFLLAEYLKKNNIVIKYDPINSIFNNAVNRKKYIDLFTNFNLEGWNSKIKDFYANDLNELLKLNLKENMNCYDAFKYMYNHFVENIKNKESFFENTYYLKHIDKEENIKKIENIPNNNRKRFNELIDSKINKKNINIADFQKNLINNLNDENIDKNKINEIYKSKLKEKFNEIMSKNNITDEEHEDVYYYLVDNGYLNENIRENNMEYKISYEDINNYENKYKMMKKKYILKKNDFINNI